MSEDPDVPDTGAVFTFGKSKFAENAPSKFWIKRDNILNLSCGDQHTAVLTESGRLFAFGQNEFGQLGLGHHDNVLKPSCVKSLKPDRAILVACGKSHTLVFMGSGRLFAFGSNSDGQLGIGRESEMQNQPVQVKSDIINEQLIKLAAGCNHSMALGKCGTVFVWGSNKENQLGLGDDSEETIYSPQKLHFEPDDNDPDPLVVDIACGYYHSAILTASGSVYMFGEGDGGKLGLQSDIPVEIPTKVDVPGKVVQVSCGGDHSLAVTEDGSVFSFGLSNNGQLGLGTRLLDAASPTVVSLLSGQKIVMVSCGENHSAVINDQGQLFTFGDGRHGKLCLEVDTIANHYSPTMVSRFMGYYVEMAVCGGCHTMVKARPVSGQCDQIKYQASEMMINGYEEMNVEARKRHREERLPPLRGTKNLDQLSPREAMPVLEPDHDEDEEADDEQEESKNCSDKENEQKEVDVEDRQQKKKSTKNLRQRQETNKISNLFKKNFSLSKATTSEPDLTSDQTVVDADDEDGHKSSPPEKKLKKRVTFFGPFKKSSAKSVASSAPIEEQPTVVEATNGHVSDADDEDEDDEHQIEAQKVPSSDQTSLQTGKTPITQDPLENRPKKSKACVLL